MGAPDINIPSTYTFQGPNGDPIEMESTVTATVNTTSAITQLPDINTNIRIREIPKIFLDTESRLVSDSRVRAEFAITEIPSVRVHFPAKYDFGISVLGIEVLSFSLCGEGMIITEPYEPNRCEICEPADKPGRTPVPPSPQPGPEG